MMYIKFYTITVVAMIVLVCAALPACKKMYSKEEASQTLAGEYELFIGTNQSFRRADFVSSKLIIRENGSFEQHCTYQKSEISSPANTTWAYSNGGINFSLFKDCAGVWPKYADDNGANLIVEFSKPPIILLSPDINVFYRKVR